jgi:hypothetical protein
MVEEEEELELGDGLPEEEKLQEPCYDREWVKW